MRAMGAGQAPASMALSALCCPGLVLASGWKDGQRAANMPEASGPRWLGTKCAAGSVWARWPWGPVPHSCDPGLLRVRCPGKRDVAVRGWEREDGHQPHWPEPLLSREHSICSWLT